MNPVRYFVSTLSLFVLAFPAAHAQTLQPGELAVGPGAGQIGLVVAVNEECRGPATISPTSNGNLAILDRVNGKIVVLGGAKPVDIPLPPDLIEPTDFVATTRGYLVVGALGDVVSVDDTGTLIARVNTGYDPESGSPRLISMSSGSFALENLKGQRTSINLSQAETGALQVPGLAKAGDYIQTVKDGDVALASKSITGPLGAITVKSNYRIASVRPVWVGEGNGALIAVQETRRLPRESSFVRLLALDANGKPTAETYLRPETFACDTVRAFTRLTDGRIVSLSFQGNNKLMLNVLELKPVGTATPVAAAEGSDAVLIASEQDTLRALEQANGSSDASEISLGAISRTTILQRARHALELKWLLTPSAYSQPGIENRCEPPKSIWKRAALLEGKVGTMRTGVPYNWGGYLPELETFLKRISNNYLASNVCTCRNADCVNKKATGLDCSGFVSYAWRAGNYYTTASLDNPNVSAPVTWDELSPGDIVNKRASHVSLVEAVSASPNGPLVTVIESASRASCGGVCRQTYTKAGLQTQGYKPLRRLALVDN